MTIVRPGPTRTAAVISFLTHFVERRPESHDALTAELRKNDERAPWPRPAAPMRARRLYRLIYVMLPIWQHEFASALLPWV